MVFGTLAARPFRLVHPEPGSTSVGDDPPGWTRRGRHLVTGPAVYLVDMVTPTTSVRAIGVAVDVRASLHESGLLPHEAVDERVVARRAAALRRARVDQDPVLLTHSGGGLAVAAATRDPVRVLDVHRDDTRVTVSRVEAAAADVVLADLTRRTCLVADGHHRLAAAAAHARRCPNPVEPDGNACARVSALVVDSDDTPLTLGPIHRVLQRRTPTTLRLPEVLAALDDAASVDEAAASNGRPPLGGPVPLATAQRPATPSTVAAAAGTAAAPDTAAAARDGAARHLVTVVDRRSRTTVRCSPQPDAGLPTTAHVVEAAIGSLGASAYTRRLPDPDRTTAAATRRGSVALILPPITQTDILDTVAAGRVMPLKATSFGPKLPAGTLIRPLTSHW